MIKTVNDNQENLIRDILTLHCPNGIDLDPTYSKGNFYKNIPQPKFKSDLFPQSSDIIRSDASSLWLANNSINSIMFDPPFLAGHTKEKPTGVMGERFHGFRYVTDLWNWYDKCLVEFHRVLNPDGVLIFKCQDTVSSGKQWLSHVHIINKAQEVGFYTKDLFILTAKNRIVGHNHKIQKHARKFHSYFLVLIKR
jgi:tRNA G10  N-methylase Trm11